MVTLIRGYQFSTFGTRVVALFFETNANTVRISLVVSSVYVFWKTRPLKSEPASDLRPAFPQIKGWISQAV